MTEAQLKKIKGHIAAMREHYEEIDSMLCDVVVHLGYEERRFVHRLEELRAPLRDLDVNYVKATVERPRGGRLL